MESGNQSIKKYQKKSRKRIQQIKRGNDKKQQRLCEKKRFAQLEKIQNFMWGKAE